MPSVYQYTDYRQFLGDAYKERRAANSYFSYRFIAQRAGFSSPGFFANVLKGKKDISLKLAMNLADLFKLNAKEKQYFELLVLFTKAQDPGEKQEYLRRLLTLRGSQVRKTAPEQWEFYEHWQTTAVREALALKPFQGDFRELAARIWPSITEREAKRAMDLLQRLGMVQRNARGVFERTDQVISVGDDIGKTIIEGFQIQTMELARKALEKLPSQQRNFSTLTLSVSRETYDAILDELRSFRRKVLEMARQSENPDRILQMNFHAFPMSPVGEGAG